MMRMPLSAISCTQSAPDGGLGAVIGRQGAMNPAGNVRWPALGAERSRELCERMNFVTQVAPHLASERKHVPEKAGPARDAGWPPVFRQGHAPTSESCRTWLELVKCTEAAIRDRHG